MICDTVQVCTISVVWAGCLSAIPVRSGLLISICSLSICCGDVWWTFEMAFMTLFFPHTVMPSFISLDGLGTLIFWRCDSQEAMPDLYTAHSWLGLLTFSLMIIQVRSICTSTRSLFKNWHPHAACQHAMPCEQPCGPLKYCSFAYGFATNGWTLQQPMKYTL